MFGLYRRCGSSKDTISVNDKDNGSNLNTFTNSSNINTIPSSILYNRTHRSGTGKIMNVLLVLFLVFGSCSGVSFGMDGDENEKKEKQQDENKAQESILHAQFIVHIQKNSSQNGGNGLNQDVEDWKDITHLIRFLICMDLIDRDRCIHDAYIKSSGYYYPWYLKHHIFTQPFYRGLGGTKQFSSKYKFIGCDWYFSIGNVPYVGGLLTLAFVCKPTFILKYSPTFLQDKVTIHTIDFKPFYFLITYFLQKKYRRADDLFSTGVVAFSISKINKTGEFSTYDKADLILLYPSLYLGLFVVQVKITEYYDISVNLFGWLLGKLVYKLLETRNKFIKNKKDLKIVCKTGNSDADYTKATFEDIKILYSM